jgi:hypothetical protein
MDDFKGVSFAWAWIFYAVSVSIFPFITLISGTLYNFCPHTKLSDFWKMLHPSSDISPLQEFVS